MPYTHSQIERRAAKDFYRRTVRLCIYELKRLGVDRAEDIEDILQETYLEAFRDFDQIKRQDAKIPWLLTILRRRLYASRRKYRPLSTGERTGDIIDPEPAPDSLAYLKGMCRQVIDLIESQHQERREALILYFLEGYNTSEIATLIGVGVSTLTTWTHRFRQLVKENMGEHSSLKSWKSSVKMRSPL